MFDLFVLIQPYVLTDIPLFFHWPSLFCSAIKFPTCPLSNFPGVKWPKRLSSHSKIALVHPCRYRKYNINYHLTNTLYFFFFFIVNSPLLFVDFFLWLFQAIKSFIMAKHPSATVGGKFPQHHLRAALKKGAETGKVMISHPTTLGLLFCNVRKARQFYCRFPYSSNHNDNDLT